MALPATDDQAIRAALIGPAPDSPRRWRNVLRVVAYVVVVSMVLAAGWFGVIARNRTFENTGNLRMWWDIVNGFNHGQAVVADARDETAVQRNVASLVRFLGGAEGTPQKLAWSKYFEAYLQHYEKAAERSRVRHDGVTRYNLDYAPLRLLIMSAWVKHTLDVFPDAREYEDRFAWPLMHFNSALAGLGAVAMFALVFGWRRACDQFAARQPATLAVHRVRLATGAAPAVLSAFDRTLLVALLCAAIFFLNPATILNSHGFVQWDTWIMPFVLGAMALAALEKWGLAGALLGLSMGFKGQVMIVTPALLLWPIFGGQFFGAARFIIGFVWQRRRGGGLGGDCRDDGRCRSIRWKLELVQDQLPLAGKSVQATVHGPDCESAGDSWAIRVGHRQRSDASKMVRPRLGNYIAPWADCAQRRSLLALRFGRRDSPKAARSDVAGGFGSAVDCRVQRIAADA